MSVECPNIRTLNGHSTDNCSPRIFHNVAVLNARKDGRHVGKVLWWNNQRRRGLDGRDRGVFGLRHEFVRDRRSSGHGGEGSEGPCLHGPEEFGLQFEGRVCGHGEPGACGRAQGGADLRSSDCDLSFEGDQASEHRRAGGIRHGRRAGLVRRGAPREGHPADCYGDAAHRQAGHPGS